MREENRSLPTLALIWWRHTKILGALRVLAAAPVVSTTCQPIYATECSFCPPCMAPYCLWPSMHGSLLPFALCAWLLTTFCPLCMAPHCLLPSVHGSLLPFALRAWLLTACCTPCMAPYCLWPSVHGSLLPLALHAWLLTAFGPPCMAPYCLLHSMLAPYCLLQRDSVWHITPPVCLPACLRAWV